jgi:hypothetical protein
MKTQRAGFPFIALGIAFVVLGITSNRTFLYVGIVFIVAAFALLARARR